MMSKKKNKKSSRSYDSKLIHEKNLQKTLHIISNITPKDEPKENMKVISDYYKEKSLDRKWKDRRRWKDE